jgi:hypothetical protein
MMAWCEANGVDFLFGLAKNERLIAEIKTELDLVAAKSRRSGRTERRFKSFMWTTRRTWSRQRRIVAKAEWTHGDANPRFVVTSLGRHECKAKYLYEKVYCARGDMETRIKECQLDLYADPAPRPPPCGPINCAYGLPPWPTCSSVHCVVSVWTSLRHHSSQAAQDRCDRARQRSPHQDRHGVCLSGCVSPFPVDPRQHLEADQSRNNFVSRIVLAGLGHGMRESEFSEGTELTS